MRKKNLYKRLQKKGRVRRRVLGNGEEASRGGVEEPNTEN